MNGLFCLSGFLCFLKKAKQGPKSFRIHGFGRCHKAGDSLRNECCPSNQSEVCE